ncbi:MAG TPA: long-chain fatty acid--CoA ligase [Terriglobales bacterium]|nr:long-chain fatty acid--CoA ligase [Terriglobales bacterium]
MNTINEVFYAAIERNLDRQMLFKQTIQWISISASELYRDVTGTARSLAAWGIGKGDRVAILSENRPEWAVADFATLMLSAVDVPIYTTLTGEQTAYILKDSGARVIFVSTADQLKKVLSIKGRTALEKIVVMDYIGITEGIPMHRLMVNQPKSRDPELDARALAIGPDDLATLIYTSGTTGTPKGVMLTHGNLASNLEQIDRFQWTTGEVGISFLPLSHITARHLDYTFFKRGVTIAYCPDLDRLPQTLLEVRPTVLVGVPRIYEKARAYIERSSRPPLKRPFFNWALRVGRAHKDEVLAGRQPTGLAWKLADALLFSKVRKNSGGRVRTYISGGAPLGVELAEWFASVGIVILEGYGLTETSPVIAVNTPAEHKLGTVGRPVPNIQVKIAEDGEILVKGPSVFKSYWNLPEETKNAFEDGWFKTGDIGSLDAEGYLTITDRKKDLIKTSGGKFIAPQPLENALKANPLVAQAVVIGDRRRFASVILAPDFRMLEDWARANRVAFAGRQQLIAEPRIRALFDGIVADLNQRLAQFETLKKVLLVPDEFSVASGELTPSMKLKRRVVEERYRAQIEALYAQEKPDVVPSL